MRDENDKPMNEEELELARRGEALVAAAVRDTRAPQSLREEIERTRARSSERAPLWRRHLRGLVAAGGVAVVLAAVAIALQARSSLDDASYSSVETAARLTPAAPAPASLGGSPPVLDARVGALEFPDWEASFDWTAVGRRDEDVSGRSVTTVYYRNPEGVRLGYAVVAGEPLGGDPPGRRVVRDGNSYDVRDDGGRTVVTWTQQGHTCLIVASSKVPRSTLLALAASRNT